MSVAKALATACLSGLAACGAPQTPSQLHEAWNQANDPLNLGSRWERRLASLPVQAELARTPWSDTYWPSNRRGIAWRWQQPGEVGQPVYALANREQILHMTPEELARLSPAEKFDIANAHYDFPTVRDEWMRTSVHDEDWFGICHGWAVAALNFAEPRPSTFVNADGIGIPFGASDVKALLTYYQGEVDKSTLRALGTRCEANLDADPKLGDVLASCRDTNAGAFHVVLANLIGSARRGFAVDVVRGEQVWNQPVYGFASVLGASRAPSAGSAPGTVREVMVETQMRYAVESAPSWDALVGTPAEKLGTKTYQYWLELDQDGAILGGSWASADFPDFLWTEDFAGFGQGDWRKLGEIYANAVRTDAPGGSVPPMTPAPL